jgi:hypothetical protein
LGLAARIKVRICCALARSSALFTIFISVRVQWRCWRCWRRWLQLGGIFGSFNQLAV